jgi:hypothetical protein
MQDNLFGYEDKAEIIPPEDHDGELLSAWDAFRYSWRRRAEGKDTLTSGEHKALVRDLDRASVQVLKAPARTLEGVKCKLAMALCSGPDAELFLRRFVLGHRLPDLMPFNDFATSQVLDALAAIERLMARDEVRTTH